MGRCHQHPYSRTSEELERYLEVTEHVAELVAEL